ncbi:MAG: xylose isomerase, partial [Alphaproteobacteria bacterium]|nr:xylose isomerase [Alphaproteobacteria bacterium]
LVPDFGIFGFRPSEVLLAQYERRGAKPEASAASNALADLIRLGQPPFDMGDVINHTAGNLRVAFKHYVATGECEPLIAKTFAALKAFADARVPAPSELDYVVVSEAIMLSNTSLEMMRQLTPYVVSCHGKFNYMSDMPGHPGQYREAAIDYDGAIGALRAGDYTGYINSEYEGQRYFQDRTRAEMMSEVDQVRRHHEMLRRLTGVGAEA